MKTVMLSGGDWWWSHDRSWKLMGSLCEDFCFSIQATVRTALIVSVCLFLWTIPKKYVYQIESASGQAFRHNMLMVIPAPWCWARTHHGVGRRRMVRGRRSANQNSKFEDKPREGHIIQYGDAIILTLYTIVIHILLRITMCINLPKIWSFPTSYQLSCGQDIIGLRDWSALATHGNTDVGLVEWSMWTQQE